MTLVFTSLLSVLALSLVSAQTVNVNVPGLDSERKHRWWVWLIISVAGFCFIVSLLYVVRGIYVFRKRARERIAAACKKAEQADVEAGISVPAEDPKIGLFSFWDTEASQLKAAAAVAADSPSHSARRIATQVTAADEAKLRQHGMGPRAQRRKECLYRMGQHVPPQQKLRELQRQNSC